MHHTARKLTLGALAAGLLLLPGAVAPGTAAAAIDPRFCSDGDLYGREGLTRTYELTCYGAEAVTLAEPPTGGTVGRLELVGQQLFLQFTPTAGRTAPGEIVLRVTGWGDTTDVRLPVTLTPRAQNTAPSCEPQTVRRRTDGLAPTTVTLTVMCTDAEHDMVTVDGAGPGTFTGTPVAARGGTASWGSVFLDYRTFGTRGTETAAIFATDDLGARSADAPLTVETGPDVDTPTVCMPSTYQEGAVPQIVPMRAGAVRRFALLCHDEDGDDIAAAVGDAPQHGQLSVVPTQTLRIGMGETESWYDVTYTPDGASDADDPFTLVTTTRGQQVTHRFAMRPVPAWLGNGPGCGHSGAAAIIDQDAVVELECDDPEGDPVTVRIAEQPPHGTVAVGPARTTAYGKQRLSLTYTPERGFKGTDTFQVEIGDGTSSLRLPIMLFVREAGPVWPAPPMPPAPKPAADGTVVVPKPVTPAEAARTALGGRAVRLVGRAGAARIYADQAVWKRGVSLTGRAPVLAIGCAEASCPVRTTVRVERGVKARAARTLRGTSGTVKGGAALPVRLTLTARDRKALRGKRGLKAAFTVTVGRGAKAKRTTVRVALRG